MTNYTNKLPTTPKVCYQQPHKNTINNYMRTLPTATQIHCHQLHVTTIIMKLPTIMCHVITLPTRGVLGIAKSLPY